MMFLIALLGWTSLVVAGSLADAPPPTTRLEWAVVRLTAVPTLEAPAEFLSIDGRLVCTAFSVHREKKLYLTADHCLAYAAGDLRLDLDSADIVARDNDNDLGLLRGLKGRPALPWRPTVAPRGTPVIAAGYGAGVSSWILTSAVVAHPYVGLFTDTKPGYRFYGNFLPGMSGGPIVDDKGRLVSVVQFGGLPSGDLQDIGGGVGFLDLFRFLKANGAL